MKFFSKTALILTFLIAGSAQAQIPVTDSASIATQISNQVESITKWVQQFNQMKQQIDQYRQQFEAITGARGMGALLDSPLVKTALPKEWQSVIANVKSTASFSNERKKFPTLKDMPKTNEMYDVIASQNAVMTDLYKQSHERLKQIQDLMGQIDSANDPAAKQDLANRLISEQNAVQANQNLVTILQAKQRQELEVASQAAVKEYTCKEFNRKDC